VKSLAHYVICAICGKKFNRDSVPCEQVSARRYAHIECIQNQESTKTQEELDKEALEKYIMDLLKEEYISPRVRKQIKQYIEEYKYSYSGIRKALIYFYEVKGNDKQKANGSIGIVPYIYKEAYNYYYSIWMAQQKNEGKEINNYKPEVREVRIPVPKARVRKRKLFAFFEEDDK
jgi:hypothetical protein